MLWRIKKLYEKSGDITLTRTSHATQILILVLASTISKQKGALMAIFHQTGTVLAAEKKKMCQPWLALGLFVPKPVCIWACLSLGMFTWACSD